MKGYLFRASVSMWPRSPLLPNTNSSWLHFGRHGTNPAKTNHIIFKTLKLKQPKLTSGKKTVDPLHGGTSRCRHENTWGSKPKTSPVQWNIIIGTSFLSKFLQQSSNKIRRCDSQNWLGPYWCYQTSSKVQQGFCVSYLLPGPLNCSRKTRALVL